MTSPPQDAAPWHSLLEQELYARLGSTSLGLSSKEAKSRLERLGANVIEEPSSILPWEILLSQFKSLMVWLLLGAAFISGFIGDWMDCGVILGIVVLNGVIGFYQEFHAEKSIAALKKMTSPSAKVWRDENLQNLPAPALVPGDILEVEAGDIISADARILSSASLKCVEAALTGESQPVSKNNRRLELQDISLGDRENMLFTGTSVATGTARGIVVATGMNTEIGRIAKMMVQVPEEAKTPLQQKLQDFGMILVFISLGIVCLLFVIGLLRGMPLLELFMTSVSLAVAAVPEGLPAVVTVALGLGVLRMSRRQALMRRLSAIETLGETNVICTDKTGTLTVGEMTVRNLWAAHKTYQVTGEGYQPRGELLFQESPRKPQEDASLNQLLHIHVGCNKSRLVQEQESWKVIGDPTEGSLLCVAGKGGVTPEILSREWPLVREIPFDSDRKRQTFVRRSAEKGLRAFTNGAPDVLLNLCNHIQTESGVRELQDQDREQILAANSRMAQGALRVIGSAFRDLKEDDLNKSTEAIESRMIFAGLAGMHDPPRAEAKNAIERCKSAGIRVVMITGDHPQTASSIARELGLADSQSTTLSGKELDRLSDPELQKKVTEVAVFARVTAEHKLRIVRAWKANHAIVAMTGDGVNDAPAIKGADIGIAMGRTGTEVTKQASDMVITDDNFASIVAAIEEGRGIYNNIRKTIQYLLSGNTGELLLMTACILAGMPVPLLAIHLLWINLVTDGLPALCLASDPIDPDVMKRPPREKHERLTDGNFLYTMGLTGFLTAGITFAVYWYALKTESETLARTHAFAILVFSELFRSFGSRSDWKPFWKVPFFSNLNLVLVVTLSIMLQVWSHHSQFLARIFKTAQVPFTDCLLLLAVSLIPFLILEALKITRHFHGLFSGREPSELLHSAPTKR